MFVIFIVSWVQWLGIKKIKKNNVLYGSGTIYEYFYI